MSLSTTIKSIQDIMRKDVGVDGDAQRIGQLVWLMFLKIWDDREKELELIEDDFVSPLVKVRWQENGDTRTAADLRWRSWASDPEGITGDKLLGFVDKELFPALKGMDAGPSVEGDGEDARAAHKLWQRRMLVKRVFEDASLANDGTYSSTFSKWFSRYLEKVELKTAKTSFHSFRHNLKDFFRQYFKS